ncbi:MAG: hypothetical protein PHP45_00235 [Elusimicrobiales bacterium]|nr:hypothetical protein [Elusimicrobiales bacterium]
MRNGIIAAAVLFLAASVSPAQPPAASSDPMPPRLRDLPVYISLVPDLNKYYMYANGGWDGNWYAGYNNCWTVKLPPAPAGTWARAFIGAKLGRAKSIPQADKPWIKVPIEGKMFIGISQAPAFSSQQSFFLVESKDIPREALPGETVAGTGGAQWFWAEVPASAVSADKPNYLALWSDSELFSEVSNSPVIAGAEAKHVEDSAWVNGSFKGTPPRDAGVSPGTPVNGLAPAMVIKLIPPNDAKITVKPLALAQDPQNIMFSAAVEGRDVRAVWLEISYDRFDWQRITSYLFQPPYAFTVPRSQLPSLDTYFIRAAAADSLENTGYSKEVSLR